MVLKIWLTRRRSAFPTAWIHIWLVPVLNSIVMTLVRDMTGASSPVAATASGPRYCPVITASTMGQSSPDSIPTSIMANSPVKVLSTRNSRRVSPCFLLPNAIIPFS